MRCRRCRTSPSTRGQLIDPQSRASPSGPFTSAALPLWRPTYPSVPGLRSPLSSQAHLTRVSTLSGSGSRPYPASYTRRPAEGQSLAPISCCLSATGIRFPGHPTLAGRLGLPYGWLTGHVTVNGSHRGSHVAHARDATGVGASCISGAAVLVWPTRNPRPAPAASQRQPLYPAYNPSARLTHNATSTEVHAIHPSGLPLARDPLDGTEVLRLSLRASHPAVASDARRGWGQAIKHRPETTHPASAGPPICESARYVRPRVATPNRVPGRPPLVPGSEPAAV